MSRIICIQEGVEQTAGEQDRAGMIRVILVSNRRRLGCRQLNRGLSGLSVGGNQRPQVKNIMGRVRRPILAIAVEQVRPAEACHPGVEPVGLEVIHIVGLLDGVEIYRIVPQRLLIVESRGARDRHHGQLRIVAAVGIAWHPRAQLDRNIRWHGLCIDVHDLEA